MKKIYLTLLPLAANFLFSQNTYYSGRFLDLKDNPKNFLKVHNKNNGVYELTDDRGFAIIEAKENDTLTWNNGKSWLVVRSARELKKILENQTDSENVRNITSGAYDSLVTKEHKDEFSLENSEEFTYGDYNSGNSSSKVRRIKKTDENSYEIKSLPEKYLVFNGSFTTSFDIKSRNSVPDTQKRYVQGRSESGQLIWRGPETGEMFSFGPDISSLGYDHQPYPYDVNGRLIPLADGTSPAKAYRNDIFKTVAGYNNQLRLGTTLKRGYYEKLRLSVDLGQQKDMMYFADQYHVSNSFKTKLNTDILKFYLNFGFSYDDNKAVNSNRIGLYNRVYQNSLLTPVSFSNTQSSLFPDGSQRIYGQSADNPYFLLDQNDKYNYRDQRRQFSFDLSRNWNKWKLNISQTYENDAFRNTDLYKPSTYGFVNGIYNSREQKNRLYYSSVQGSYSLGDYRHKSVLNFNFILNNRESGVYNSLTRTAYAYQRTSQDYILNYKFDSDSEYRDFKAGFNVGNAFYISNTSVRNNYWLPKLGGYLSFDNVFDWHNANFKIIGSYTQLSSEPEITGSYASYAATTLNAQNAYLYFPVLEADTFRNLSNINSREGKIGAFYEVNRWLNIEAEYFNRKITDDVFPVFENNRLLLKNMADHTYSGFEINAEYNNLYLGTDFKMTNKASFFKYKDVVDRVNPGYNGLAVSGFRDIYKTLSEGEVLGAVKGSYFERNAAGELVIDEFGYPKKADGLKIIADPTPDFVMKFNHTLNYKMLTLDINWEWKKGGQIWNGTQAVLDYYGRSQSSGEDRNIKNYVFQGVNEGGAANQIPVDFYDPGQNVSENRWTRYGYLGVAEDYVQKADYIRINNISLTGKFDIGRFRRGLGVTLYVNNILLWQANKGADPNQNFYDLNNGKGLDFFNLPSYKTFGCMVSFQF